MRAEEYRELAEDTRDPVIRLELYRLAVEYEAEAEAERAREPALM